MLLWLLQIPRILLYLYQAAKSHASGLDFAQHQVTQFLDLNAHYLMLYSGTAGQVTESLAILYIYIARLPGFVYLSQNNK